MRVSCKNHSLYSKRLSRALFVLSAIHRVIRDDAVIKMPPLEQMAALCTRNEFYLQVKFFIIRPFTMILSGPFPTKNNRLRIYQV